MIRCATGTVSISSSLTVGQTVNVTTDGGGAALTGFHTAAGKVVQLSGGPATGTGFFSFNMIWGSGFAVNTTTRRAFTTRQTAATTPTNATRLWVNDACHAEQDSSDALVGALDYNGTVTDGFQLIVDDQFPTTRLVSWWAIWGDELEVAVLDFTSPAATGNVDYNVGLALNTGQDDKVVFIYGGPNAAAGTPSNGAFIMRGAAAGNTPVNGVLLNCSNDNVNPSEAWAHCRVGDCIAMSTAVDAISERGAVTQWNSDGFRVNWSEVNGTAGLLRYTALVLKGPQFKLFDILSRTDTTQTDEVIGFDPLGIQLFSASRAEDASDTTSANLDGSVGYATSSSSRNAVAVHINDNDASPNTNESHRTDCAYASIPVSASAEDAFLDIVDMSVGGGGFTFVMDDVEPSQSFIWGVAAGAALTANPGSALFETAYFEGSMQQDDW